MSNSDILRMLSPLVFFVIHVTYLIAVSNDHFLNKWIDGSFTFFVALVLCNVIRARLVAQAARSEQPHDAEHAGEEPESSETPGQGL